MNAQKFTQKSLEAIQAAQDLTIANQNTQMEEVHLLLSLPGTPSVDVSGAQAVLELCQRLLAKGHTIAFCGVAEDVRSYFDRAGVTALVGESAYFHSADRAILALLDEELLEA